MRKTVLLAMLVSILSLALVPMVKAPPAVELELGLCIDGSGSIDPIEFQLMKDGIAEGIRNNLPHDGRVELCVIQFGDYIPGNARVEVPATVLDSDATAEAVALAVEAIVQAFEWTPTADGLLLTWLTMQPLEAGARQVINVATDGLWNIPLVQTPPPGWPVPPGNPQGDVEYVRANAAAEGLDEIDAEGVGVDPASLADMRDYLVYPQPGTIAPPHIPGWVEEVADFTEFAAAIATKFEIIIEPVIPEVPLGTIMVSAVMIIALIAYVALPKFRKEQG